MAIASAGSLLTEVVSTTLFQRIVPDAVRGRALGTIATVSTLAYAAGSLVMPVAAGVVGMEPVLLASGALVVVGAVVSVLLIGRGGTGGPSPDLVAAAGRVGELPVFAGVPRPGSPTHSAGRPPSTCRRGRSSSARAIRRTGST